MRNARKKNRKNDRNGGVVFPALPCIYCGINPVIPAKAGIQSGKKTGFRVKPGMTIKEEETYDALHWVERFSLNIPLFHYSNFPVFDSTIPSFRFGLI